MKVIVRNKKGIPFSKWCEDNNLTLRIDSFCCNHVISFQWPIFFENYQNNYEIRAEGETIHKALLMLVYQLNRHSNLFFYENDKQTEKRYIKVPLNGLYLDFIDVNTQEVTEE